MVWSPCSPRDSQESSPGPQIKSINSLLFCLLFGPTLTSISDYWNERMTILVFSVHLGWKTRESWVVLLGKSFVTISSCLSLLQMWKPRPTRLPEAYTGPVGQSQNDIHIYFPNFWSGLFPLLQVEDIPHHLQSFEMLQNLLLPDPGLTVMVQSHVSSFWMPAAGSRDLRVSVCPLWHLHATLIFSNYAQKAFFSIDPWHPTACLQHCWDAHSVRACVADTHTHIHTHVHVRQISSPMHHFIWGIWCGWLSFPPLWLVPFSATVISYDCSPSTPNTLD